MSSKLSGDGGCSFITTYRRANGLSPIHQLDPKISSHLALFCIHHTNRVLLLLWLTDKTKGYGYKVWSMLTCLILPKAAITDTPVAAATLCSTV